MDCLNYILRNEVKLAKEFVMKKKFLILGIVLVLIAMVAGVAFAYFGPCSSCPPGHCEKFTFSGNTNIGGRRLCTCGHTQTPHEWIN